jgi:hypothetical protein
MSTTTMTPIRLIRLAQRKATCQEAGPRHQLRLLAHKVRRMAVLQQAVMRPLPVTPVRPPPNTGVAAAPTAAAVVGTAPAPATAHRELGARVTTPINEAFPSHSPGSVHPFVSGVRNALLPG